MSDWDLEPGAVVTRTQVKDMAGGDIFQGIATATRTNNVMVYSDPEVGLGHGYAFDGQFPDGRFHYTGAGQVGDQELTGRNRTLLEHADRGYSLRVFEAVQGQRSGGEKKHHYLGEFAVDPKDPYREERVPDGAGGHRQVLVFHLSPVGQTDASLHATPTASPSGEPDSEFVPPEDNRVKAMDRAGHEGGEAERREAELMALLEADLSARGCTVGRMKVWVPGESTALWTDTFDQTHGTLYEVKADATRENVRMAIGQLIDYHRFVTLKRGVVVLPEEPRPDLVALAHHAHIGVAWLKNGEWWEQRPGAPRPQVV